MPTETKTGDRTNKNKTSRSIWSRAWGAPLLSPVLVLLFIKAALVPSFRGWWPMLVFLAAHGGLRETGGQPVPWILGFCSFTEVAWPTAGGGPSTAVFLYFSGQVCQIFCKTFPIGVTSV